MIFVCLSCLVKRPIHPETLDHKLTLSDLETRKFYEFEDKDASLGLLNLHSCSPTSHHHEWTIPYEILGQSQTLNMKIDLTSGVLSFRPLPSKEEIRLLIPKYYPQKQVFDLCESPYKIQKNFMTKNPDLAFYFESALKSIFPDCSWQKNKKSWVCQLEKTEYQPSIKELKTQMSKHWEKIPYMFTRRMAITEQLNDVLETPSLKGKKALCDIIKLSDKEELPYFLTSPLWQKNFCAEGLPENTRSIGVFGFQKAMKELFLFHRIHQEASLSADVKIHITEQIMDENIRVNIMPDKNIKENLRSFLIKKRPSFWSPFFDDQKNNIAQEIGILPYFSNTIDEQVQKNSTQALDYISEGISGETSFLVIHGDKKRLRLLKGSYTYQFQKETKDFREKTLCIEEEHQGVLDWNGRERTYILRSKPIF